MLQVSRPIWVRTTDPGLGCCDQAIYRGSCAEGFTVAAPQGKPSAYGSSSCTDVLITTALVKSRICSSNLSMVPIGEGHKIWVAIDSASLRSASFVV